MGFKSLVDTILDLIEQNKSKDDDQMVSGGTDIAISDGSGNDDDDETAEDDTTEDETSDEQSEAEPVDSVKGIGATYAERLEDAGIETVSDLEEADPSSLADEAEISEKRLSRWQDRIGEE